MTVNSTMKLAQTIPPSNADDSIPRDPDSGGSIPSNSGLQSLSSHYAKSASSDSSVPNCGISPIAEETLETVTPPLEATIEREPILNKQVKRPQHLTDIRSSKKSKNLSIPGKHKKERSLNKQFADIPIIHAEDLRDSQWEEKNKSTASYKTVASAVFAIAEESAHGGESLAISKEGQKKNQINWLAVSARQNDAVILEKSAAGKQKQRGTTMKYGW